MRILAFNPGSNSLKFQLVDQPASGWGRKLVTGAVEPIGPAAMLRVVKPRIEEHLPARDLATAASAIIEKIHSGGFGPLPGIDLIACRVVHGGIRFQKPVLVDGGVLQAIEQLDDLAPLHNAQSVAIIKQCLKAERQTPIVAVFDSGFHSTLPEVAYRYAINYELADRWAIRRYGFHGLSHRYLMLRYAELQGVAPEELNLITLHLEGGSSATAIRRGVSVDTSMGFTPLAGLMMATRCGDLDPAVVPFLMRSEKVDAETVETWLNKKSGLLGVSGCSPDTRVLVERSDHRSRIAIEMFAYRVRKYIGAYLAALNGAAAIVFGGGIGENTPLVRELICSELDWFGMKLDTGRNREIVDREGQITEASSRLHAWVIPTEEGLMIAREASEGALGRIGN